MGRLTKAILILFGILAFLYIGLLWYFSSLIIHPNRKAVERTHELISQGSTEAATYPTPEEFEIEGERGAMLKGWYFHQSDSAECAVVLAHGIGQERSQMLTWAKIFWECGCEIAMYDHRGHGESEGDYVTGGILEKKDLFRVTDFVQNKTELPLDKIGWLGISWGGATVLEGGTEKEMAFIISDSPFESWEAAIMERAIRMYGDGINYVRDGVMWMVDQRTDIEHEEASPLLAAGEVKSPVFLIHSRTDSATLSHQSERIDSALSEQGVPHAFYHTDWGSPHVGDIDERPEEYKALVYQFLKANVPQWKSCEPDSTHMEGVEEGLE